jgi:hypothetical protein
VSDRLKPETRVKLDQLIKDRKSWGDSLTPEQHKEYVARAMEIFPPDVRTKMEKRMAELDKQFTFKTIPHLKRKPNRNSRVLLLFVKIFSRIVNTAITIYQIFGLVNIYFAYEIYKVCRKAGWTGIFHTKWTLYVVIYLVILLCLRGLFDALFHYEYKNRNAD